MYAAHAETLHPRMKKSPLLIGELFSHQQLLLLTQLKNPTKELSFQNIQRKFLPILQSDHNHKVQTYDHKVIYQHQVAIFLQAYLPFAGEFFALQPV